MFAVAHQRWAASSAVRPRPPLPWRSSTHLSPPPYSRDGKRRALCSAHSLQRKHLAAVSTNPFQQQHAQQNTHTDAAVTSTHAHAAMLSAVAAAAEPEDGSSEAHSDGGGADPLQAQIATGSISHVLNTAFKDALAEYAPAQGGLSSALLAQIDQDSSTKQRQAQDLFHALQQQQQRAADADTQARGRYMKQGLVMGAHVPLTSMHHRLSQEHMKRSPDLARHVVQSSDMMSTHVQQKMRESGNAPWNVDGPGEAATRQSLLRSLDAEVPGYLSTTAVTAVRGALALSSSYGPQGDLMHRPGPRRRSLGTAAQGAASNSSMAAGSLRFKQQQEEVHMVSNAASTTARGATAVVSDSVMSSGQVMRATAGSSNVRNSQQSHLQTSGSGNKGKRKTSNRAVVSGAQRDADATALSRIERKLQFLRNPRHDNRSRWHDKMLTGHGKDSTSQGIGTGTHASDPTTTATMAAAAVNYFVADPLRVEFSDYAVGGTYRAALMVRNVTALARHVRVLPPSGKQFAIGGVTFPAIALKCNDPTEVAVTLNGGGGGGSSGLLAPGMALRIFVDFTPDSLGADQSKVRTPPSCAHNCTAHADKVEQVTRHTRRNTHMQGMQQSH